MPEVLTPHLSLPLPHPGNSLDEDVLRIRDAFTVLDQKIAALDTLLSSDDFTLDSVMELVAAIKANRDSIQALVLNNATKDQLSAEVVARTLAISNEATARAEAIAAEAQARSSALAQKQDKLTTATQAEMEAGAEPSVRAMSPLRISQAIGALAGAKLKRSSRTSNTILGVADNGKLIDITSGTFTQTFSACATLGDGWFCYLKNSGTGDITLDPNASELIDGLAGYVMYPGEVRLVQSDGTTLRSVVLNAFYRVFTASGTFIKPPGYRAFSMRLYGGGGGGGKPTGGGSAASGGGGGACHQYFIGAASVSNTETVTVGSGGLGATTSGSGTSGGTSSFGNYAAAYGGGAGYGQGGSVCAGGGGGGLASAGSNGSGNGLGGYPNSAYSGGSSANTNTGFGGGASSTNVTIGVSANGSAVWGGGGGGYYDYNNPVHGAGSVYGGGGGGGGVYSSNVQPTGGRCGYWTCGGGYGESSTIIAGNGGVGGYNLSLSGGNGGVPSGGGGGGGANGSSFGNGGDGARGEVRIHGVM